MESPIADAAAAPAVGRNYGQILVAVVVFVASISIVIYLIWAANRPLDEVNWFFEVTELLPLGLMVAVYWTMRAAKTWEKLWRRRMAR